MEPNIDILMLTKEIGRLERKVAQLEIELDRRNNLISDQADLIASLQATNKTLSAAPGMSRGTPPKL